MTENAATSPVNGEPRKLNHAELRTLFLFEALTDEQLAVLAEAGDGGAVRRLVAGSTARVSRPPASSSCSPARRALSRRVHGDEVEFVRTDQRGAYAGATRAFMGDPTAQEYINTFRAVTDAEVFQLPADTFAGADADLVPDGGAPAGRVCSWGMRNSRAVFGEQERLLALGPLSAGLTHELNNPAAAAVRATAVPA